MLEIGCTAPGWPKRYLGAVEAKNMRAFGAVGIPILDA